MRALRWLLACTSVVLVMSVTAACGSSKKSTASSGGGTTIAAQDYQFSPNSLSTKAGASVTFTFKNEGKTEHNFSVTEASVSTDAENGDTKKVTFTAPSSPGSYQFFCKYHKARGMTGTLTVT